MREAARSPYWAAFDRVRETKDLATASVEMVLHELAQEEATAPQVRWLSGLKWFEVDTPRIWPWPAKA